MPHRTGRLRQHNLTPRFLILPQVGPEAKIIAFRVRRCATTPIHTQNIVLYIILLVILIALYSSNMPWMLIIRKQFIAKKTFAFYKDNN